MGVSKQKNISDEFEILHTINLDWNMSDMTYSPSSNDVIVTDTENCRLNKISRDGEITMVYNMWISVGSICINDTKEVVVRQKAQPYVDLGIYSPDTSFNENRKFHCREEAVEGDNFQSQAVCK